ncbi:sugar phosphate isomerase/epimerase family protein [Nakamurella lactea]|uniref:sugar phosphate isomerase/epimerase family protein n=1 Tax=Nakamurella lactea TaxID=459515 RepID=UPI0012B58E27|nr:TIM barrel protein [Nakamurella lactea]
MTSASNEPGGPTIGHQNLTCVSGMAAAAWPLPDELAMYRRIDTDLAGLPSHKTAAFGHDRSIAEIARSGVQIGYLVHPLTADPADDAGWAEQLDGLRAAVDIAAAVDAARVYLTSGPSGGASWEQAAELFVGRLTPVVEYAGERGIRLAVENTLPVRCDLSFTHSVRDAMALARMSGMGLCLDFYCCWQEGGLAERLREGLDLVELVQVSDFVVGTQTFPNRWVPGDADLPIARLLAELLALGTPGSSISNWPDRRSSGRAPSLRCAAASAGCGESWLAEPDRRPDGNSGAANPTQMTRRLLTPSKR